MDIQLPGAGGVYSVKDLEQRLDDCGRTVFPNMLILYLDFKSEWSGLYYPDCEAARAALDLFAGCKRVLGELENPETKGMPAEEMVNRVAAVSAGRAAIMFSDMRVEMQKIDGVEKRCLIGDMTILNDANVRLKDHLETDGRFRLSMRCGYYFAAKPQACEIQKIYAVDILTEEVNITYPFTEELHPKKAVQTEMSD